MHLVYILRCADNSYYTGISWNLDKRVWEHNSHIRSGLPSTKIPVKLVYWQSFCDKIQAARREKEIKGWRREKKEDLIKALNLIN